VAGLIAIFAAGFAVFGTLAFRTMEQVQVNGALYKRIVQSKDLIADILPPPEYIVESYLVAQRIARESRKDNGSDTVSRLTERLGELEQQYRERHEFWKDQALSPKIAATLLEDSYKPAEDFYQRFHDELVPAVRRGDQEAVDAAIDDMDEAYQRHRVAIDQVVAMETKENAAAEEQGEALVRHGYITVAAVFAVSLILAVVFGVVFARRLLATLGGEPEHAVGLARSIAKGDLTRAITVREGDSTSLVAAMSAMQRSLSEIVHGVRGVASTLRDSSSTVASASEQSGRMAQENTVRTEQIASAINEMTATVQEVARSAAEAAEAATRADEATSRGTDVVNQTVSGMTALAQEVERVAETVQTLAQRSADIGSVLEVIQGVAEQTNLLALNAAIEAARAGEQGRGFAVVADEVRSLASRTQDSTREIEQIVSALNDGAEAATTAIEAGRKRAADMVQRTENTGEVFNEIGESVSRISDMNTQIASAAEEQNSVSEDINRNISEISSALGELADTAQETARSAEGLEGLSRDLDSRINEFTVDG
jgi:methyl-accepting chemotaxis protein